MTITHEQAKNIASQLSKSSIMDYCKANPLEYEKELEFDVKRGAITIEQYEKEKDLIKSWGCVCAE